MRSRSIEPEFATVVDGPDVRIKDPIERTEFDFYSLTPVELEPASTEPFKWPVDSAVKVRTARLETARNLNVVIRTRNGEMIKEAANEQETRVSHGEYLLQLLTTEMMIYLMVESSVAVKRTTQGVALDFGSEVDVRIGARSYHTRPAAIIDTTDDPNDIMKAISMFGSALKTTSPERSFPTSRGHPPLITLSDNLRIPDSLERPDTGIWIEVPPEYKSLYIVSPLAYYLGAEVVPGDSPVLTTENGFDVPLKSNRLHEEVSEVLRQVFFLDCITRTEGAIKADVRERNEVETELDLNFEELYHMPLSEQLEEYLSIPFEELEEYLPRWRTTVDIEPEPEHVEMLSHAANDLAIVRCPSVSEPGEVKPQPEELTEFYRSASKGDETQNIPDIINIEPADSIEHVWVGDGFAIGASKARPEAYRRQFDTKPKEVIEVDVVCNDSEMIDEHRVSNIYGIEETYTFEVARHEDLSIAELRDLIESPTDFLHYIGHVTSSGINCSDGLLDVRELDDVRVRSFMLNGCQSYLQGDELVKRGSSAGVVTLSKIGNNAACEIGVSLARLLNNGFPIQAALNIAKGKNLSGNQYAIVGDGSAELVRSKSGSPVLATVEKEGENYTVTIEGFPSGSISFGTLHMSFIQGNDVYNLDTSTTVFRDVTKSELEKYFNVGSFPVRIDDNLFWSGEISPDAI